MTTPKPIAAFIDNAHKCLFVRYPGGAITRYALDSTDLFWFGDCDENEVCDPDGIVWAALTGQRSNEAVLSLKNLPKRKPNITKFYADDEPLTATNCEGAVAQLERIRAAARKLSIDQGGVRDNQDVKALLVEIFAP